VNADQIKTDVANLECEINIYQYVRYDPEAWTNELRINKISEALN
jgi:hypothetical protein